jgi:kynureninase
MTVPSLADARALDAADPLRPFRARFELPDGLIYLDGNSLGALPKATPAALDRVVREEWGRGLIGSWNAADWIGAPQRIGAKIARLVGAEAHEVVVADSTSVNLFKLLAAALARDPARRVILSEPGNFPTDLYVAQGLERLGLGARLKLVERERMADALDGEVAVLMLTHVHYKSGARHDMAALSAEATAVGALSLWDLSHSTGGVPVELDGSGADLAVGCGYKYLNGGPGAPAFLYVAERWQDLLASPLTGWMGHAAPFAFDDGYRPAPGIDRFLCGTPPVLQMATLECGLDLMLESDPAALFAKGQALCDMFITAVDRFAAGHSLELVTPREALRRGSHVSWRHADGYAVMQALIAEGVVGDFRAPDILRFGFAPLYNSFEDAWRAANTLHAVLAEGRWRDPRFAARQRVT